MIAGLPGADRRSLMRDPGISSPALCAAYLKCYKDNYFEPNPDLDREEWDDSDFTYETSLCHFCVDDIVTIIDDLIDEKL